MQLKLGDEEQHNVIYLDYFQTYVRGYKRARAKNPHHGKIHQWKTRSWLENTYRILRTFNPELLHIYTTADWNQNIQRYYWNHKFPGPHVPPCPNPHSVPLPSMPPSPMSFFSLHLHLNRLLLKLSFREAVSCRKTKIGAGRKVIQRRGR